MSVFSDFHGSRKIPTFVWSLTHYTLHMFYILLSLFTDTLQMTTGHKRADKCSLVSLYPFLRHRVDTQDTSEHVCARPYPYFCLFDTAWTHRTRASTSVLARALCVPIPRRGHPGHERAYRCSLVSLSLFLRHCVDAQDMSEHIGACLCPVCPYSCPFDTTGHPGHKRAHRCSLVSLSRSL